jgi:hypothetical protein
VKAGRTLKPTLSQKLMTMVKARGTIKKKATNTGGIRNKTYRIIFFLSMAKIKTP